MGRRTYQDNWRVSVEVDQTTYLKDEVKARAVIKGRCEDVAKSIRRHVDDVSWVGVIGDTIVVCEHCGYKWSEPSGDYNGGCCDEDEKNNPENLKESANG